jgi:hypothetical protein
MARQNRMIAEYLRAMRAMTFANAEELAGYGIPWKAIAAVCPVPMRIIINRAGDRFWPDDAGKLGWVLPVAAVDPSRPELIETDDPLATISTGPFIDLVASFSPAAPGRWALRRGLAAVLGAIPPQYMQPEPVRVHRDIAAWLRAGCSGGIVLLTGDPEKTQRVLGQSRWIDNEEAEPAVEISSPAATRWGRTLDRRRLEGLVRKIITANRLQREGVLRWATRRLVVAASKGEIQPAVAEAVLVRAATRAGIAETVTWRIVTDGFAR